jgi:hypothetical protein
VSFGIQVDDIVTQTMPGGRVFVDKIVRDRETTGIVTTYTYANVAAGSHLRVLQVGAGAHSWVVGTSSGQATVTLTAVNSATGRAATTTLYVFAAVTNEPTFGIQLTNDSGERTASTVYPCPEFVGRVTFSGTPSSTTDMEEDGYWRYTHTTSTSIGSGRNRIVLWKLPSNAGDVWFRGTNFIEDSVTGAYNISASYYTPVGTPYTVPEAFVFALDGLVSSGATYGIRLYDPTGVLLFDGAKDHMVIKGYETTVDYPTSTGITNTYAGLATMTGTPAFFVPGYQREVWTNNGLVSQGQFYSGTVRKNGSTLYTKLIRTGKDNDDALLGITYEFGLSTNITQVVVDATRYGG